MELVIQIAMGVGLAACAGLRTWFPLLCLGLLARTGYMELGTAGAFLARTDLLIALSVATVVEFAGDKIPAVDHVLDAVGTFARPVAGALLTASVVTHIDPVASLVLGLIVGGGTALTVHTGKSILRAQSTAFAPLHAGAGNTALSFGEDVLTVLGVGLAVFVPLLAFGLALLLVLGAVRLAKRVMRRGYKLWGRVPLTKQTPILAKEDGASTPK